LKEAKLIRIGYFEDFRTEDSILISVDALGLEEMIALFGRLGAGQGPFNLLNLTELDDRYRKSINARAIDEAIGMRRIGNDAFEWSLPAERWRIFQEMAQNMRRGTCHQYLDCDPEDNQDLQVVLSFGEYGDEWWERFFE
jgi:hypothetical protein